jgi:hypothetical protein
MDGPEKVAGRLVIARRNGRVCLVLKPPRHSTASTNILGLRVQKRDPRCLTPQAKLSAMSALNHVFMSLKCSRLQPTEAAEEAATACMLALLALY